MWLIQQGDLFGITGRGMIDCMLFLFIYLTVRPLIVINIAYVSMKVSRGIECLGISFYSFLQQALQFIGYKCAPVCPSEVH